MRLLKDLIVLGLALTGVLPLSGCVSALIPNGQVAQTTAGALGASPALIRRLGDYQTVYRLDYIEVVSKGRIYYCSMSIPDVMGAVVDIKGTATCRPDRMLQAATAKVLKINPSGLAVRVQKVSDRRAGNYYEIAYTATTKDHGDYSCIAAGEADKARLFLKRPPKCKTLVAMHA